jgi:hypothetical protein
VAAIVYKEWLPDQPDLGNPGLIVAMNCLPTEAGYTDFHPLNSSGPTFPSTGVGTTTFVANGATKGSSELYVAISEIYSSLNGGAFTSRAGSTVGSFGGFTQYENLVIAVGEGHTAFKRTTSSASNFSTLNASADTLRAANVVGLVGQFVVMGDFLNTAFSAASEQSPNEIQWCSIDQPTLWPTPNSATAIATQAGNQFLHIGYGPVRAVHGGDQFAVVLQADATTRMTYEGPPTVFRFDVIDNTNGSYFKRGSIKIGGVTYFISRNGFCRTDGVSVERIGQGKVDQHFWSTYSGDIDAVHVAHDPINNLFHCAYPQASDAGTTCSAMLSFHLGSQWWSAASTSIGRLITPGGGVASRSSSSAVLRAIAPGGTVGAFAATAGTATFETGEFELTEAGRSFIDGVKPNVESSGTAPSMVCRVGYRDSLGAAPTYTATAAPHSRTGVANFRVDAKYLRLETQFTGNFEKATGVEFDAEPAGYA